MTGDKSISKSELPKYFILEGIYPNSLASDGSISGYIELDAKCTLGGSESLTSTTVILMLIANNTYYTLPHESEYSGTIGTLSVWYRDIGQEGEWTTVVVRSTFKDDVGVQGHGLLAEAVSRQSVVYPYLARDPSVSNPLAMYCLDTNCYTASERDVSEVSIAKYRLGENTAVSALDYDRNSPPSIYIPLLRERIVEENAQYEWLANTLQERRQVDDLGSGGGEYSRPTKWMDIFVEFISKDSRPAQFRNYTMVQILGGRSPFPPANAVPRIDDLLVEWRE